MESSYLRSGVFLSPYHNYDENPTLSLERDLELLELLDRLNYHEAWIGEHHTGGFEIIASPELFIAVAAHRTRHIRLGTGVVSLPYHNPFILAGRMVQLDHMTRGRAMFGIGPGAHVHDALKMGIAPGDQRRMMNEALDVLVPLLHGKTVTRKADWFNLIDAQLQLRCYSRPTIELAVAAARSPVGALAAGKYGIGMLSRGANDPLSKQRLANNWTLYEESARANAQVSNRNNWRVIGMFHVAETREQARENVRFGLPAFARYVRDVATLPIIPPEVADPCAWLIESGSGCIGTPDDAISFIEGLISSSGGFGVLCEMAHNWADWQATTRHYELMARFVHPHFQKACDGLRGSYDFAARHQREFTAQATAAIQNEIDRRAATPKDPQAE
jgi:limonene 1,2-monooxygenase